MRLLSALFECASPYQGEVGAYSCARRERVISQRATRVIKDCESRQEPLNKDPLWGAAPHLPLSGGEIGRGRG